MTQALAKTEEQVSLAIPADLDGVRDALVEIGDELSIFDSFTTIKFPSGTTLAWSIATPDGDYDTAKTLTGIMLDAQTVRQYWKTSIDDGGGGTPPDCASPDGFTGIGNPGGDCASCPLSRFGSAANNAQACSQRKHVLLLTEDGGPMPYFLSVPPSSYGKLKRFQIALANRAIKYWHVVVELGLAKAKSGTGIEYAELVCKCVGVLDEATRAWVNDYRDAIRGMIARHVDAAPQAPAPDPAAIAIDDYTTGE